MDDQELRYKLREHERVINELISQSAALLALAIVRGGAPAQEEVKKAAETLKVLYGHNVPHGTMKYLENLTQVPIP